MIEKKQAHKIYWDVRFGKLHLDQAYKNAFPRSKAAKRSCSIMGRRYYNWYEEHCADDIKVAMKDWGLDFAQLAEKERQLLNAKIIKQVTITESYEDEDGKIHQRDMKSLQEFEDNGIQMRATEFMGEILGATKEAAEEIPLLIIHRLGRNAEIRFRRKLNGKSRKKHGEDSQETTK